MTGNGAAVVVTGATQGIGAAAAERFATDGAPVVLVDVDIRGADVAARLKGQGGQAVFVEGDVACESTWQRVAAEANGRFAGVRCLVSNASTVDIAAAHETTLESWNRQIAVNLSAAFLGVRACVESLRLHRGSIVIISSVHALAGLQGHPAYAASKGGLTALSRQLAVEYGPDIRVNCVVPGPIMTAAWDRVNDADRRRSADATVVKRFGTPAEVANVVAFLASDEASYMTGSICVVDGGWSIVKDSA